MFRLKVLVVNVFALSALLLAFAALAQDTPDATVEIESKQIALIVGGTKGKGVLTFQGNTYPFSFQGLGGGAAVGISKTTAVGEVFGLKNLADFNGEFSTAAVSGTFVVGAGAVAVTNEKGVTMRLTAKQKGLSLNLGGISGMLVELD